MLAPQLALFIFCTVLPISAPSKHFSFSALYYQSVHLPVLPISAHHHWNIHCFSNSNWSKYCKHAWTNHFAESGLHYNLYTLFIIRFLGIIHYTGIFSKLSSNFFYYVLSCISYSFYSPGCKNKNSCATK